MSLDLSELYQELILDHGKKPRNHHELEGAAHHAEGYNPLCGDRVTVYVDEADGAIRDISFTGDGCAICMASASLMTQHLKGKATKDADACFEAFRHLLTDDEPADAASSDVDLGKLAALSGVKKYPIRIKCATLPWHTMEAALHEGDAVVTTE